MKNQKEILNKLGIAKLNAMQLETISTTGKEDEVVLLSPTGSGKTLAFLLPIISQLDTSLEEVQALIVVPSRELAIQIEQVIREMGSGFKANAVYGGRAGSKDKIEIKHRPAILIGTPGRIADHIRRDNFSVNNIVTLVLDEFDKSLEIGFESEMKEIIGALPNVRKKMLTSATHRVEIPSFVHLKDPVFINYLKDDYSKLDVKRVVSPDKDKLDTLVELIRHIGPQPGLIFCNFKDTIQFLSDHLTENAISHGCFYGGMEQKDRERALIKFRNGSHQLLIATDLAARGIDIPELKFIIHYQLPLKNEEFIHRNGRTARMHNEGTAYVVQWEGETVPSFIDAPIMDSLTRTKNADLQTWDTLFISGGRKDKISKGDIAGLFLKQGNLTKEELGVIELKQDCAFVAVSSSKSQQLIALLNNTRLKKKKVRISIA